jgi:hypothetical protein
MVGYLGIITIYKSDFQLADCAKWGMTRAESSLASIKEAALLGRKFDFKRIKLSNS